MDSKNERNNLFLLLKMEKDHLLCSIYKLILFFYMHQLVSRPVWTTIFLNTSIVSESYTQSTETLEIFIVCAEKAVQLWGDEQVWPRQWLCPDIFITSGNTAEHAVTTFVYHQDWTLIWPPSKGNFKSTEQFDKFHEVLFGQICSWTFRIQLVQPIQADKDIRSSGKSKAEDIAVLVSNTSNPGLIIVKYRICTLDIDMQAASLDPERECIYINWHRC